MTNIKVFELKKEECCEPAARSAISQAQAEETASLFAALAETGMAHLDAVTKAEVLV